MQSPGGSVFGQLGPGADPVPLLEHDQARPAEHGGEDQEQHADGHDAVQSGAEQGAGGGGHAEEDADADVGQAVADVGRRRAT